MTAPTTDPTSTTSEHRSRIVVGVDGSEGSDTALGWALRQARLLDADLDVVAAWDFEAKFTTGFNPAWPNDAEHLASAATTLAENSIAKALAGDARPDRLTVHAIQGSAALVLTEHARGADLLVIGTRGRGGFTKLLLGSVSTACVKHATCPTVVVPAGTTPTTS